jgi:hypothetical protein
MKLCIAENHTEIDTAEIQVTWRDKIDNGEIIEKV